MNIPSIRTNILIVDDNLYMRKLIRSMLASFVTGSIFEAENGREALELHNACKPDMVLTDWEMPGMNGIELAGHLRNEAKSCNIFVPICLISSFASVPMVRAARDAGINEYLVKTISLKGLHERINNIMLATRPFVRTRNYFGPCRRRRKNFEFDGADRRLVMKMAENKLVLSDEGQYQCTLQKWTQMVR